MGAALFTFSKYEWLVIIIIFMVLMWFLRRADMLSELFSGVTKKIKKRSLGKKYEDDRLDYEAFKVELLGTDIELGEFREKLHSINQGIFKGEVKQVSYLELWVLINLYSKKVVKSDSNIYYLHKENYIHNLDIKNRDLVNWIQMIKNDKIIKKRQVEANFLLHKIRTGQLNGKSESESQNYISSIVFDGNYFFATREGFIREVQGENPLNIKIKILDDYEVNEDYVPNEKEAVEIDVPKSEEVGYEIAEEVINETPKESVQEKVNEAPEENPVKKYTGDKFLDDAKDVTTNAKGDLVVTKQNGNKIRLGSKIDEIGKEVVEKIEIPIAEDVSVIPKKSVIGSDDATKARFEREMSEAKEEGVDDLMNILEIDGGYNKRNRKNKKSQPEDVNKPEEKKHEEKKEEVVKRKPIPYQEFIQSLEKDMNFIEDFLREEDNEIFLTDDTKEFYISGAHLLSFIFRNISDQDTMRIKLYKGSQINVEELKRVQKAVEKSINLHSREENDLFAFVGEVRKTFQKKKEGRLVMYQMFNFLPNEYILSKKEQFTEGIFKDEKDKKKIFKRKLLLEFAQ